MSTPDRTAPRSARRAARPPRGAARVPRPALALALLPALVAAVVAVLLVAPQGAGLGATWPWVPVLAFRGPVGALALAAAVALALLALAARALGAPAALRTGLAALVVVAAATAVGEGAVLAVRGLHDGAPTTSAPAGALTVLEVNTDHSRVAPATIAALVRSSSAQVVTMPETDGHLAGQVAALLGRAGAPVQVFSVRDQGRILPSSLLVADSLGRYRQVGGDGQQAGLVVAEPVGSGAASRPLVVAAHPQAPVRSWAVPAWRSGVTRAVGLCASSRDAVLAGDFNSTLDHLPLHSSGACADAARRAGSAGISTWPQPLPRLLGAPLDHVLATSSRWRAAAVWTRPLPGSDHRALVARLVPRR